MTELFAPAILQGGQRGGGAFS